MIAPRFLPYVWRNVRRAPVRSLLTVLGTALALAIFAFVRTLEGGVAAFRQGAAEPVLVVFQQSRFCPLTSELPSRYRAEIDRLPGVEATLPTTIFVNQCRSNLDLVALHGVDPESLTKVEGLRALQGDIGAWKAKEDGALVGRRLAERRRLRMGDKVRLAGLDVEVMGIVEGTGPGSDNVAFVHERPLQLVRGMQGTTSEILVRLKDGVDGDEVARRIDAIFKTDTAVTDTKTMQAFVQGAVGEVSEIVRFARILGYLAVVVVALILGNTVFISAQTRAQELGTLETIGLGKPLLVGLILAESVLLALVGGLVGTSAVVVWFRLVPTTLGVEGFGIDFAAGPAVFVAGLLASFAVALVAAVGPALEAVLRPVAAAVRPA